MKNWSLAAALFWAHCLTLGAQDVDFNRDIRPIISDKCFHCHGPDSNNRKSEFQIHTREAATADLGGVRGIVPGKLDASEVYRRIRLSESDNDLMPPKDSNRALTEKEKELIGAWISQGADYDLHWSFKPIVRPKLPELNERNQGLVKNEIDTFIFAKLQENNLEPAPEAPLETRLRRASLTLAGLAFLGVPNQATNDPTVYSNWIDRLLQSDDYAERQTLRWLNAARYADTDGYQTDNERSNWPWRDWVIKAFRENMPFDQFTIEQIAGDMLPEASSNQVLASAFNRNHRQNSEGGALAAEFFIENVIDRVETTSTVWLGLTMGCARCHDHKYDPLSQREFYQLFSYFNNIGERGIGRGVQANPTQLFHSPLLELPSHLLTELQKAEESQRKTIAGIEERREEWIAETSKALKANSATWMAQETFEEISVENKVGKLVEDADHSLTFQGKNALNANYRIRFRPNLSRLGSVRIDALPDPAFGKPRQLAASVNGNFVVTDFKLSVVNAKTGSTKPVKIGAATATFEQQGLPISQAIDGDRKTGWGVFGPKVRPEIVSAYLALESVVTLATDEHIELRVSHESQYPDHCIGRMKIFLSSQNESSDTLPAKVIEALLTSRDERSRPERKVLSDYYKKIDRPTKLAATNLARARKALDAVGGTRVPVMVMREADGERRPAYLLERGQYDAPDRSAGLPRRVPAALFQKAKEDHPADRLELARWIASPENPLTARVIVNRIWQDHFGIGLVETPEDFGSQGAPPSHPRLLDWLAAEFIDSGWNVRALQRLIVTSATFQQSSAITPSLLKRDPSNRLLARGPRFRLDGFAIRDLALQAADLLDRRVGGPPVKPYQPAGLWNAVASNSSTRYQLSSGGGLYRKSLYTYWKRAVNPPRQLIFDAGGREACDVSVRRTNTPLQALVLMNDQTFIEAAQQLASKALSEPASVEERLTFIYRRVTGLSLKEEQRTILRDSLAFFDQHFQESPKKAEAFLRLSAQSQGDPTKKAELAAWAAIAHLVMNLDLSISVQ